MADYEGLDYDQLAQAYMRLLAERGPGFRGIPYEGATYQSKDPGGQRWREGEVEPNVGFLDPVDLLSGMLASKGATLARRGVQRLRPRPGVPRTGGRGLVKSERGSTGGGWWDDPDDVPFSYGDDVPEPSPPPLQRSPGAPRPSTKSDAASGQLADAIARSKERVSAVMDEHVAMHGEYNPDLHEAMYEDLNPYHGESLMEYVQRLIKLEERYNADAFYGKGQFPPATLEALSKTLDPARASSLEAEAFANPTKRTVDMATGQPLYGDLPPLGAETSSSQPSRANEYADIIRKLFEQEGQ